MPQINREFMSYFVVAAGVCVGAWMLLVRPQLSELNTLNAAIAQHHHDPGAYDDATFLGLADQASTLRKRVEQVQQFNALGRDSSRLYGEVMNLAEQYNVDVQQLQAGAPTSNDDNDNDDGLKVGRTQIEISIVGTYSSVADFLDAVDNMDGFLVSNSLSVSPMKRDGQRLVQANLSCTALQFPVQGVLNKLDGVSDAAGEG